VENDQTEPGKVSLAPDSKSGGGDTVEIGGTVACIRERSVAGPLSMVLVLGGAAMQGYANGTVDALFAALLMLLAGAAVVCFAFPGRHAELRAFLLTYGVCVFAGGLAQCYSLAAFGHSQSLVDAIGFYDAIFDKPPYYTWSNFRYLWIDGQPISRGVPLAPAIWQAVYHVRGLLGLDFGIYTGVMFNALTMGLTGSITVRTARELFGDDVWRLRRVGTLFAFCGLFLLFGAVLIRDCFTTFVNALVLWGIVRWLCRPTSGNLLLAGVFTGISASAMMFLRAKSVVIFGLFWFLAFVFWFLARRLNLARIFAAVLALFVLLITSSYLMSYLQTSQELQAKGTNQYVDILETASQEDSIAMRLIVNQPMPIRLVLGTGSLMVFPIPLWAYFNSGEGEYHLIKGYHGIYQFFVLPFVLAGFMLSFRMFWRDRAQAMPLLFLAIYLVMNIMAVVATSLEQRHIAQFMPAFMILAAVPDTREKETRERVQNIAIAWWCVVVLVHVAWAIAAFGR